jgi:hypothetical protein
MRAFIILLMLGSIGSHQSDQEFVNKTENYTIVLAADWRPQSYTDAVGRQKTEFVFHQRAQGLLTITKESLIGSLSDRVRNDQNDMRLRCASVYFSEDKFDAGQLSGIRVAVYYVQDSRKVVGTYYYLQDRDSVWVLRFTGEATSTGITREITDRMARSFCSVCPFP